MYCIHNTKLLLRHLLSCMYSAEFKIDGELACSQTVAMLDPAPELRISSNTVISSRGPVFIVAEIGQNHQGCLDVAKELIRIAKEAGADCVKFQKTCLPSKFNGKALQRPYTGANSWGDTYGAHKKFLEFSVDDFRALQRYAEQEVGIMFSSSAMDEDSVDVLDRMGVPFLKVGSGDNCNLPLLRRAADTGRPLIVSTGMMSFRDLIALHAQLTQMGARFALLHCVSCYPTPPEHINLRFIPEMKRLFPDIHIGYSGHEVGIEVSIGAVAIGAKILERHLTLDRRLKGTDHSCSLEPEEFARMVRSVRVVERALGRCAKDVQPCELECWNKLGKSLVAARDLPVGHQIAQEDLHVKVAEPKGIPANRFKDVLGLSLRVGKQYDDSIMPEDVGLQV